ncbi:MULTISPECIES: lipase family protein [unclassified Pseudomonas]|uniref:lipase family protein n=1 Tax=unclassified Pseudomonas TaxID=196821 RepID=UPI000C88E94F|nr:MULTISPECIES: lipase family protein [unclassified Pseudomonas]PMZ90286.1 signal peptide-containing protein [Pseudomonas sp. FW305-42]PNA25981.1 signal peptide-containing protein [Pseudomonas sp. MPR-R1B]PNB27909.1 signal peptide-containing protein [Pseudomonas sp. DP16D-E2]PNB44837.1 signal peptide-containing protein [Pseudomonas sp. FW305-17]PNB63916.1 signal peptide-containing protein [Pseudomonas sp. GW531-E2]
MKLPASLIFGLSALALSIGAMAAETYAPKPDPQQGDGRVSAFYTWTKAIPATPGKLLRSEPLEQALSLPNAASAQRLLYTSLDGIDGKTPIVVSGALFIPKGKAPAGGWPVASWGHGTVGVADICAPSWAGRSYRDVQYLNRWLDEGYAIVATDYQGLGVPGGHPLLNNRMAAYGILDAAKAVVAGVPGLADKVLIIGQSQGGAGAFAAGAYAATYAPKLGVKGSIGTGVIYTVGAKNVGEQDQDKVDPALAYGFYTLLAAQQYDPSIDPRDFYTDKAMPLFEQARTSCLSALVSDVVGTGLTPANAKKDYKGDQLKPWLAQVSYPTLKLAQPIFIGTGAEDKTPAATTQVALMQDACKAGSVVQGHLYKGLGHSETVNASLKDSIPFARQVISDQPVAPNCSPSVQ